MTEQHEEYVVAGDVLKRASEMPPPEPEPVPEQVTEPEDTKRSDEPLTGDEIKEAATGLYTHAKEVWLQPVRKEVRSWFRAGREFLDSLGSDR